MKALTHCLYLVLLLVLTSCMGDPSYYEKDGHMHVKGYLLIGGRYDFEFEDSDPSTFQKYVYQYSKDANHVYYVEYTMNRALILRDADPATFRVLLNDYSCDSLHVWWRQFQLPNVNSKDFHVLNECYAITDSMVITGCHLFSFEDKDSVEWITLDGADPTTFEVRDGYERDKYHVFYHDEIVEGADPATFLLIRWENDSIIGQDKYREYKLKR